MNQSIVNLCSRRMAASRCSQIQPFSGTSAILTEQFSLTGERLHVPTTKQRCGVFGTRLYCEDQQNERKIVRTNFKRLPPYDRWAQARHFKIEERDDNTLSNRVETIFRPTTTTAPNSLRRYSTWNGDQSNLMVQFQSSKRVSDRDCASTQRRSYRTRPSKAELKLKAKIASHEAHPPAVRHLFDLEAWAESKVIAPPKTCEYLSTHLKSSLRENNAVDDLARFGLDESEVILRWVNSCLHIYSKADNAHASEATLLELIEEFSSGQHDVSPTSEMYTTVLTAWTRSNSSRRAERAERLLKRLEKEASNSNGSSREIPSPDVICYSLGLSAWAKSDKPNAGARAESLLKSMPMDPNIRSYTSVLSAWSRSDNTNEAAVKGAELLWSRITETFDELDDWAICTMITAWGQSNQRDAMEHAEKYYSLLQNPSAVQSYTALIQAWSKHAYRRGPEAVERVEYLLSNAQERPNSRTFAAVLQTIAMARGVEDRGERARRILKTIREMGAKVTPYVSSIAQRCHEDVRRPKALRGKRKVQKNA